MVGDSQDDDFLNDPNDGFFKTFYKALFSNSVLQVVTWLVVINTVIFIAMAINGAGVFEPDTVVVIKWGAASKQLVMAGEYWRLFTACFLHFGVVHLLANMIGLFYASIFLVSLQNRMQFLIGYLASGIFSFAVSMWWHNETVSAGASGAIFGCYGMLLGLAFTPLFNKEDRLTVFAYLGIYAGFNLLYGIKDGVDNAAHIGGLIAGTIIGLIYYYPIKFPQKTTTAIFAHLAVLLLAIGGSYAVIKNTYYYGTEFYRLDKQYTLLENKGLEYYKTPDTSYENKLRLVGESVTAFDSALQVANSMVRVKDKPDYDEEYANRLVLYSQYRLTEFQLLQDEFRTNTDEWYDSISTVQIKIDSLLKRFAGTEGQN
ncbi:MAG: rhomboid family intramembrane serine protease [Chitinophagales bacterium]